MWNEQSNVSAPVHDVILEHVGEVSDLVSDLVAPYLATDVSHMYHIDANKHLPMLGQHASILTMPPRASIGPALNQYYLFTGQNSLQSPYYILGLFKTVQKYCFDITSRAFYHS